MAERTAQQQLFYENMAQSKNISMRMFQCGRGTAETVARTKTLIAQSLALIAEADRLLAR